MPAKGLTGKAGKVSVNGNVVSITKMTHKLNVEFADSTDSYGFNPQTGQLFKSQLSGDIQMEGTMEGYYDLNSTAANLEEIILNAQNGPYPCFSMLDGLNKHFNGMIDLSDFETNLEVPGAVMVGFTANWKSNGPFTLT